VARASLDDAARLATVVERTQMRVVPDIPEIHNLSAVRFKAVVRQMTDVRLAIGAGHAAPSASPLAATLRALALAQVLLLSPLVAGRAVDVGPVQLVPRAFSSSFEAEGTVVELSGTVSSAAPPSIDLTVLADGVLNRLLLPAETAEMQPELLEMAQDEARLAPPPYSSGRREAWLRLHEDLERTGTDHTAAFLADLVASLALLDRLDLPKS